MKYINQRIGQDEIKRWKAGERVFITAGTGTGKSYFVRSSLYSYARSHNKKILWLTNRNILREQVKKYLTEEQLEVIHVLNYQSIQEKISRTGYSLLQIFSNYDYIVYDEAHHPFADAGFNRKTDLILQPIVHNVMDNVIILMTATPQQVLMFQSKFDHFYSFPTKYDHVSRIYFWSKKETFDYILQQVPAGEKVIYFANRIDDAVRVAQENGDDARFICSASNSANKKHISWKTIDEIETENKFSCKILCTTRVLDNGVDIKDESVKHIIIDITDPVELLQCIGRKRITSPTDTVNLYIRYRTKFELRGYINRLQDPLGLIDELAELGREGFLSKYSRDDWDSVIHFDGEINRSKELMLRYQLNAYTSMLTVGYKRYICKLLGLPTEMIKNADERFQALSLENFIESYSNQKLFLNERKAFKDMFLTVVFNPRRRIKKRSFGINTINGVIADENLSYKIVSKKETSGDNRNKSYWFIEKIGG